MTRTLICMLAAICSAVPAFAAPPDGAPEADEHTVLLWHFDEAEGDVAQDASANGLDGTITGAERVEGRFGGALSWGEGNGNVSVQGDLPGITDQFTLEAWIRLDAMPTGTPPFWAADVAGRLGSFGITVRPPGVLYVGLQLGTSPNHLMGQTPVLLGEWTHVALVYDGPRAKLGTFVNGALDMEFDLPANQPPINFTEGRAFYARSYNGGDEKLVGAIDEVRLSSVAHTFGHEWSFSTFLHLLRYRDEVMLTQNVPPNMPNGPVSYRVEIAGEDGREIMRGEMSVADVAAGHGFLPTKLPQGELRATVAARLADGTERVVIDREAVYTPPDRSIMDIDADNVWWHEGKRLFPLMLYHVRQEDLAEVADAGFTMAKSPTSSVWPGYERESDGRGYIDAAWAHGMLGVGAGGALYDETIGEATLTHYRGEPSVAFWYIADEPHGPGRQPEDMLARYEQWAQWDPTHPLLLLHNKPPQFLAYAPTCDVFSTDSYPIRREGDTNLMPVQAWTRAAVEAVANRKPVIIALQCYTTRSTEEATAGRDMLPRLPTIPELRCMSYMALAEGARGLSYYSFDDTYYNRGGIRGVHIAREFPEFWAGMKGLIQELRAREAIWTAPYAEVDAPTCDNEAVMVSRYPLSDGGAVYVLAVNPTREAQQVHMKYLDLQGDGEIEDVLSGRMVPIRDGAVVDELEPLDAACYRLPPPPG